MIICRTPFRISFFGGGTDFPDWYLRHGGSVLASSIDKYCYLNCRYLPPFFQHRFRIVWSKIENCKSIEEIEHPAVKAVVKFLKIERCLEISHIGDLPARSGMGSSSAFTVGLLNALSALEGRMLSKYGLAKKSIFLEQHVLQEAVGSQDQVSAAYGGLNHIQFHRNGEITVVPVTVSNKRVLELQNHLMLFYTGIERTSSEISQSYTVDMNSRKRQLRVMKDLVDEAISLLNSDQDIRGFGELLKEAWEYKRSLSNLVSNPHVDQLFKTAFEAGAIGGKLTGAGGGGFILLFVPPQAQTQVREALKRYIYVPFKFEFGGSQIVFAEADADYEEEERIRLMFPVEPFRDIKEMVANIRHLPFDQASSKGSSDNASAEEETAPSVGLKD